ncbi:MAG: T9SS type A sorting domain-containing protein [Bacteroidetes bacterium]|nr:T9SS type A sorting domain-containing protein [Bacteroidota bacterium]
MRKYMLLLATTLGFSSRMASLQAQHTEIPNAGFEDWVFTGTYYEPFYWNTFNLVSEYGCAPFVAPDSSPVSGKVAARISTLACTSKDLQFSDTIAGIITLGERDLSPGLPANQKPTKFSFYLKYLPSAGDSAAVILLFTRNKSVGVKENVGVAFHIEGRKINTWTHIEVPVYWLLPGLPDSVQVVCTSSKTVLDGKKPRQPGSVLWLDNLVTDKPIWAPSSVWQKVPEQISVYPNPAKPGDLLRVALPDTQPFRYRIFDSNGRLRASGVASDRQLNPGAHGLSHGVYHLEVSQQDFVSSARLVLLQEP